ncbi:hypothetical protein V5P93_004491 [Actinokineospora auranticolor]|uniref:hypothetical protein n=1 Tax=Actinokineospora auranticolor TaxID=155976 RepID=UPI0011B0E441|nr:hypothetical protein [Actinokineospora auranticolor]
MDDRDEFAVPPLREVPDDVRDRLAARVLTARSRKRRGVAVLGAAVGVWGSGSDHDVPGGPSLGVAGPGTEPTRALGVSPEAPRPASIAVGRPRPVPSRPPPPATSGPRCSR